MTPGCNADGDQIADGQTRSLAQYRSQAAGRDSQARDLMRAQGAFNAKRLQVLELRSDAGLGPDIQALALPLKLFVSITLHETIYKTTPMYLS